VAVGRVRREPHVSTPRFVSLFPSLAGTSVVFLTPCSRSRSSDDVWGPCVLALTVPRSRPDAVPCAEVALCRGQWYGGSSPVPLRPCWGIGELISVVEVVFCPQRSGPRTVVKSTSVFSCFEPLGGPCSCLMKQNSCAKNRSTPLDRLSEAIPCEFLAYLCLREQESFLTPHIVPASRAIDASPSLSLSGRVKCIRLMLCLSFYEWRCIYPGVQMISAPFLEKNSLDRAPGRFADYRFVPKHPKADVLLTTVLGPLRRGAPYGRPVRCSAAVKA